jgi:phosphoribosylanthranilate isomerase
VIDTGRAREIVSAAGTVPVIGVVSGERTVPELLALVGAVGLRGIQLQGHSPDATARALAAAGLEVWRVATLATAATMDAVLERVRDAADAIVLEPLVEGRSGGRGIALDRTLARDARVALADCRVVLAGGLTPGTVGAAIRFVEPDMVDVSSGVEDAPGIKSPERVARFLEAVRDAGAAHRSGA